MNNNDNNIPYHINVQSKTKTVQNSAMIHAISCGPPQVVWTKKHGDGHWIWWWKPSPLIFAWCPAWFHLTCFLVCKFVKETSLQENKLPIFGDFDKEMLNYLINTLEHWTSHSWFVLGWILKSVTADMDPAYGNCEFHCKSLRIVFWR